MTTDTAKILDEAPQGSYTPGQEVELLIKAETDLGYKVIVDNKYWGVLYYNEVFQELTKNQSLKGFVKKQRDDGKIDLTLYKAGHKGALPLLESIVDALEVNQGYLNITKDTEPDVIYELFGASKKKFKMALGMLYKSRKIRIEEDGIYLNSPKKDTNDET